MTKSEFWDRADSINAGMLAPMGSDRWVPMSHTADAAANCLWFITAKGTDIADALEVGATPATYLLADNAKGLFAQVIGTLSLSDDRAKLKDLWNVVADSWFDAGIDDPDIRLVSLQIKAGEVWVTPTSGVRFLFNIAKARVTGEEPDMGDHFTL